jgi:hypothetical protein
VIYVYNSSYRLELRYYVRNIAFKLSFLGTKTLAPSTCPQVTRSSSSLRNFSTTSKFLSHRRTVQLTTGHCTHGPIFIDPHPYLQKPAPLPSTGNHPYGGGFISHTWVCTTGTKNPINTMYFEINFIIQAWSRFLKEEYSSGDTPQAVDCDAGSS